MRSILGAIFVTSVLCMALKGHSLPQPTVPGSWVGYKQPTQEGVPRIIVKASQSVYALISPQGTWIELGATPPNDFKPEDWWVKLQTLHCERHQIKHCPIFEKPGTGTAWSVDNNSTLMTSLHLLHPWVFAVLSINKDLRPEQLKLPHLLMQNDAKVLVSPTLLTTLAIKLESHNGALWTQKDESSDLSFKGEPVRLILNSPILADPIEVAQKVDISPSKDLYYAVGFPNPTSIFQKFGGMDAPGDTLVISAGHLYPEFGLGLNKPSPFKIIFSAAGTFGMSGGPILNASGKAVAMSVAGRSTVQNNELDLTLLGVNLTQQSK